MRCGGFMGAPWKLRWTDKRAANQSPTGARFGDGRLPSGRRLYEVRRRILRGLLKRIGPVGLGAGRGALGPSKVECQQGDVRDENIGPHGSNEIRL